MVATIHECRNRHKDIEQATIVRHYAESHRAAIEWLQANGGGIYRNAITGLKYRILAR